MPRQRLKTALPLSCAVLLIACGSSENPPGGSNAGGSGGGPTGNAGQGSGGSEGGRGGASALPGSAGIQLRLASTAATSGAGPNLLAFSSGGAVRPGLESLEYYIYTVQICESIQTSGSGFSNESGCLVLYTGDHSQLAYDDPASDRTPLADAARALDTGFVDLLDTSSRARLDATTELLREHVRSYNYGSITWSMPVKVKATIPLGDGTFLYTHDGATEFTTSGVDNYRHYYTRAGSSLAEGPAEKAVILLDSGGNWFKFQNPLTVTSADIEQQRQWVLDLVFNPEGIVKGFAGDGVAGSIEERSEQGAPIRAVTVPLLDLAPIPHRQNEQVVRESYLAHLNVSGQAFDVRLELYSVDGDPSRTVYGVDVKTLVVPESTSMPPEIMNVSYVVGQDDGSLSFESYQHTPLISGFSRVTEELGTTQAAVSCATHGDRIAAEGGAALMLDSCPSSAIDVTFQLVSRRLLDGERPSVPAAGDAGTADAGPRGDAGVGDADAAP